jgi:hypothetical protein
MKNEKIYKILIKEEIEFVNKIKDKNNEIKGLKISTKKGKIFKVGKSFIDMYTVSLISNKNIGRANSWSIVPNDLAIFEDSKKSKRRRKKR